MHPPTASRRPRGGGGGAVLSLVFSIAIFLSLLQVFEPVDEESRPSFPPEMSALQVGLEHFSSGHLKDFDATQVERAALGREHVLQLLEEAGVNNLSPEQIESLPRWQHVVDLYGPDVVIVGKERCQLFRDSVPLADRIVGPAGMFNTGTNALDLHLQVRLECWTFFEGSRLLDV
jgi:hypothetical protein